MSKLKKGLGILVVIAFVFLLVAFIVPPVRDFVWGALGPPVQGIISTINNAVTGSTIWQTYVLPNMIPAVLIIGLFGGWVTSYIWHRWIFNPIRSVFIQSAQKEVGPVMTQPLTQTTPATPVPIATTKEEEKSET
jgi:hypothetical protein